MLTAISYVDIWHRVKPYVVTVVFMVGCLLSLTLNVSAADPLTTAQSALNQSQYNSAIAQINKALAQAGQKPEYMAKALLVRGVAYQRLGKPAQAIADFSNAQWLGRLSRTDNMTLLTERANAYQAVGQKSLADKDLSKAFSLSTGQNIATANKNLITGDVSRQTAHIKQDSRPNKAAALNTTLPDPNAPSSQGNDFFASIANFFSGNSSTPATKTIVSNTAKTNRVKTNNIKGAGRQAATTKIANIGQAYHTEKTATVSAPVIASNRTHPQTVTVSEFYGQTKEAPSTTSQIIQPSSNILTNNPVTNFFSGLFSSGQSAPSVQTASASPKKAIELHKATTANKIANPVTTSALSQSSQVWTVKKPAARLATQLNNRELNQGRPIQIARKNPTAQLRQTIVPKPQRQSNLFHLQLASFKDPNAANRFVRNLETKNRQLVGNQTPLVVETDLGQLGRHYRVYLGPYANKSQSLSSCQKIKTNGMDCFIVQ